MKTKISLVLAALPLVLAACGGGGGSAAPAIAPSAPAPAFSATAFRSGALAYLNQQRQMCGIAPATSFVQHAQAAAQAGR